jgi:hypothetical protein
MILVLRSSKLKFPAAQHLMDGQRWMTCCCSVARLMFLIIICYGSSCWMMLIPLDMKIFRKCFIVFAYPFLTRISVVWSGSFLKGVQFVSEISQSTFTRLGCCNHYQFPHLFGVT